MNVLVVGDVIIDEYIRCKKRGISAETPTVVGKDPVREVFLGGAGLVARHLEALGDSCTLLTIAYEEPGDIPEDVMLADIEIVCVDGWTFSKKSRYYVDSYKMLQIDEINKGCHTEGSEYEFLSAFEHLIEQCPYDAVVICDNRHGVLNENIAKRIVQLCAGNDIPLYVDSQMSQSQSNHTWYFGAFCILLNDVEFNEILTNSISKSVRTSKINAVSEYLRSNIVHKRGDKGAVYHTGGFTIESKGVKVNAVDTCGAGDAFLAAFVHSNDDVHFANRWAALSTTYVGTVVPDKKDMRKIKK